MNENNNMSYNSGQDNSSIENEKKRVKAENAKFVGKKFICSDESVLLFENENRFVWYLSDANHDDNYYAGTYEFHFGENAMDYIINELPEFGITKKVMMDYFENNKDNELFNISNFCFMTIHNEKMVYYGETINENANSYYMGYYIEGCIDVINLKTGFNAVFVLG